MSPATYSFPNAQHLLDRDGSLSNGYLAGVLEANAGHPLPESLHRYLIRHLRGEVKRKRGRRARSAAAVDFALVDADELYQERLAYHQQQDRISKHSVPKSDRRPPQERAFCDVLEQKKDDFQNITWERLRNAISRNKRAPCPME
jgi:hypothetical protein